MSYNTFTPIVTDGLVLYLDAANTKSYPGTGTSWLDLSKNNNNGTLTNGPTFSTDGGGCIVLNGTNNYIPTNLITNYTVLTLSAWVKPGIGTSFDLGTILNKNSYYATTTDSWPISFGVSQDGKTAALTVTNGTCYSLACGAQVTGATTVNTWNHITATYDLSSIKFYVNGFLTESKPFSSTLPSTAFAWTIGRSSSQFSGGIGGTFYKGSVNNIMLYNKSLTPSEILQNYNATKWRFLQP
jgi:hypothetical protein